MSLGIPPDILLLCFLSDGLAYFCMICHVNLSYVYGHRFHYFGRSVFRDRVGDAIQDCSSLLIALYTLVVLASTHWSSESRVTNINRYRHIKIQQYRHLVTILLTRFV